MLLDKAFNIKLFIRMLRSFVKMCFSKKYLLYTNLSISTTLSGVGDLLEQCYEILSSELKQWDERRTFNMSICGTTVGFVCHHWYRYIDNKMPGNTLRTVMKKVLVDQIVCSPVILATFFSTLSILRAESFTEFTQNVKGKAWRLYTAEWIIWPPAQYINFRWVPPRFRILYDSTISLGYDIYTSHVAYQIESNGS